MRWKALAFAVLVAAAILDLPAVYFVMADGTDDAPPVVALGLVAMGLAWAGGCALEDRRRGSVTLIAILGVAQGVALLVPTARDALAPAALLWIAASAGASALGLAVVARSRAGA